RRDVVEPSIDGDLEDGSSGQLVVQAGLSTRCSSCRLVLCHFCLAPRGDDLFDSQHAPRGALPPPSLWRVCEILQTREAQGVRDDAHPVRVGILFHGPVHVRRQIDNERSPRQPLFWTEGHCTTIIFDTTVIAASGRVSSARRSSATISSSVSVTS